MPFFETNRRDVGLRRPFLRLGEPHEAVAVRKRERLQQHGINGGKHGGVGADAEGKRQHDRDGETRRSPQRTNRIADITNRAVCPQRDVHIPGTPGLNRQVAELPSCAAGGLLITETLGAQLVRAFRKP